jgi:putative peptide-modifying radical SAM enzyme
VASGDLPALDEALPPELECDQEDLARFFARDLDPVVTFYGGEPLLRIDLIASIMECAPRVKFRLHTNGTLLHRIPPNLLNKFDAISVSLDGPESLTNQYRGIGTYRKVMLNLQNLHTQGFSGEIIARMTVSENTCIASAVRYLSSNRDFSFSSIHWQLDADFSQQENWGDFRLWIEENYNPGIRELIKYWVRAMGTSGKVLRWYPFIDPVQDLILGKKSLLRCGCGHESYSIMTNGALTPCPIMVGVKDHYLGHISTTYPEELVKYTIGGRCTECQIRDFCGGRCLYSSIMGYWSEDQKDLICGSVRNLHDGLQEVLPIVRRYLREGIIRHSDLDHPKFNGCEIIP